MTSACPLLQGRNRQFLRVLTLLLLAGVFLVCFAGGCRYQQPKDLSSPWLPRQKVWAVAPLANESGVSVVDRLAVTDALVLEVASIQGVDVLPLNRTLEVMLALNIGLEAIPTEEEYQVLLEVLGADALLVGSVIAFDPYQPLRFGASIQLIEASQAQQVALDPRALTMAVSDRLPLAPQDQNSAPIQASGIFDAENHGVLIALEGYAAGRSTHQLARSDVGLYLLDMDDYTEFVFHQLLERLLTEAAIGHFGPTSVASAGS